MTDINEETDFTQQINPFWALHDEFRVVDAAALVAGVEPNAVNWGAQGGSSHPEVVAVDGTVASDHIPIIRTVILAITNAIWAQKLPVNIRHSAREYGHADCTGDIEYREVEMCSPKPRHGNTAEEDELLALNCSCFYKPFPDWFLTTIERDSLIAWLRSRHFPVPFFGLESEGKPAYLDRDHDRYSPKLAAAVRAWEALEDEELWSGQSPKSAATKWLEANYSELDLVTTDRETGKPQMNRTGIEQAAAVVNWRPQGGSPKTPGAD